MSVPLYQVDSFTGEPFAGNPAAVCLLGAPAREPWMQRVAAEMNLSETAFLVPREGGWDLRWFTPAVEVDLCGHATLAAAHVLFETGRLEPEEEGTFHTRSGLLTARLREGWIWLDLPADRPEPVEALPPDVASALGAPTVAAARTGGGWLCHLGSEESVRALRPDLKLLGRSGACLTVTARGEGPPFDFISRFFAPALGIDEDPVTGAAHCALGPWWAERLGRRDLVAFQASSRGGVVRLRVEGQRVRLGGQAVTVFAGELSGRAAPGA